jgi:hypothetical protein
VLTQKAVRSLPSCTQVSKILTRRLICCINTSTSKIQAVARCCIAKGICKRHFASYFFQYKGLPSIILLQAMWGRKMPQYNIDARTNKEFSTMLIQLHARRMLCQNWLSVMMRKKHSNAFATKIKVIFRVAVCQAIIHENVEECYVKCIKNPSLLWIQSQYRIYKCTKNINLKWMAAKKIQGIFPVHLSILIVE